MPDPNPPQYLPQPSDPLTALRKATSIGADRPPITLGAMPLTPGGPLSGLKEAAKEAVIGRGLMGPHPAIRMLMDALSSAPEEVDPLKVLAQEKVGGQMPFRQMIQVPKGMELPPETSPFIARDPALVERYLQEQNALQYEPPMKGLREFQVPQPQEPSFGRPSTSRAKELVPGFESKFLGARKYEMGR